MKKPLTFILLLLFSFLCSCTSTTQMDNGKIPEDPKVKHVIENYFMNFNDIHEWSKYSTDEFVKKVYTWCIGEPSNEISIEEMKKNYHKKNLTSLKLTNYYINEITSINEYTIKIDVLRTFENGSMDQTTYELVRQGEQWKFNNRY